MREVWIDLTDTEWISLIDSKGSGLPACCSPISALRDAIIYIVSDGRRVGLTVCEMYLEAYNGCVAGHGLDDLATLQKLTGQIREAQTILKKTRGQHGRGATPDVLGAT